MHRHPWTALRGMLSAPIVVLGPWRGSLDLCGSHRSLSVSTLSRAVRRHGWGDHHCCALSCLLARLADGFPHAEFHLTELTPEFSVFSLLQDLFLGIQQKRREEERGTLPSIHHFLSHREEAKAKSDEQIKRQEEKSEEKEKSMCSNSEQFPFFFCLFFSLV